MGTNSRVALALRLAGWSGAGDAPEQMADVCLPASGGSDPMAHGPGRIVADVLLMATLKFSDPVQLVVNVEANNFARDTFQLRLRLHDTSFEPRGI